jgi:hypothetical protein
MKFFLLLLTLLLTSACNTTGEISYETAISAVSVETTNENLIVDNGQEIKAVDCMRHDNDNPVSGKRALDNLKAVAAQNGYNAIHSVSLERASTGASLLNNCWALINIQGIAYKK